MHHILITGKLNPIVLDILNAHPEAHVSYRPELKGEELLSSLENVHILVTRSETAVDKTLIDAAPKLRLVARAAVGVANIDIEYATQKGILVMNTPGKNTNSAAEMTMALMLAMLRRVPQAHAKMKGGGWDRHTFTGSELRGKTLGLVGVGNVGHRVALFANAFDCQVLGYDPYISPERFKVLNVEACASLEEMLSRCDILSVHTPLNKETRGMIDFDQLSRMPRGSYVVNAARGGIIDEQALLSSLQSGHIAGAAIDTWLDEPEPLRTLVDHEHVWAAPHIGASTIEAQKAIAQTVGQEIEKFLGGSVVDYPVNLPDVGVIEHPLLKSYAVLAEKLGSLAAQTLTFQPARMTVHYRGDLAGLDQSLVRLALIKGYTNHVVDGYVSFVNAEKHIDRLGIHIVENQDPQFTSYKSAIKIVIQGQNPAKGGATDTLTVGGTIFDHTYSRITLINDHYFEVEPTGEFVLIENEDKPGVVGDVGHFLAKQDINIESFELSRKSKGGAAMALLKVDGAVSQQQVQGLKSIPHVSNVRSILL